MLRRGARAAAMAAAILLASSPEVARTAEDVVQVLITLLDQPALRASAAEAAVASALPAAERDQADAGRTARVMGRARAALAASQSPVVLRIRELGGEVVYAGRAFNAVAARIPVSALAALRARRDVVSVEVDEPRHALLEYATQSMPIAPFWAAGVRGGAVDVAIVDTGVYAGHEAYASRQSSIIGAVFHRAAIADDDYYDYPTRTDDYAGHGTFVTGMVFSQGGAFSPQRLGVAYGLDKLYNLKAAYDRLNQKGAATLLGDTMEAVDWSLAQADPPEVFNFSFGAIATADDDSYSRFWDAVVDGFGKVAAVSTGNNGPAASTINSPGIAWNVISVGNVASKSTASRDDDEIASTSSRGPTPGGRKKPDLTAPGSSIWLPSHYGRTSWLQGGGTSFSTPGIAGAAALLIDAGVTDPRSVKAVLINSADDLGGAGWDAAYGWGYYNGERAWAERKSVLLASYGAPTGPSGRRFFERSASAPTKATLVWNRHVSYQPGAGEAGIGASGILNDFDLRLYATASNALRASSTSARDNVEQVTSATSEAAVAVVQTAGPFTGPTDDAAIAHTGAFVERAGPGISLALSAPGTVAPSTVFTITASVTNAGDLRGHDYLVSLELPDGFTPVSDAATKSAGSLASGGHALVTWQVRAPATPRAAQSLRATGTTTSYGWQWSATSSLPVATAAGCTFSVQGPAVLPAAGGTATVVVTAPQGCAWTAVSGAGWIAISSGESGTGPGTVTLQLAANATATRRSGTLSVAGTTVTVTQSAAVVVVRRYYLAEGATGPFFDLDVVVANPNASAAPIVVTFLREDGSTVSRTMEVSALARLTIHVNAIPELSTGPVSTVVESTSGLPLVVERTMVWDADGYGGHSGEAVEGPQTRWYFAEGSQGFFDTYLLLANAGSTAASATVTFLREGEPPVVRVVHVAATSRFTFYAGSDPELVNRSFSIVVDADAPVIAERAMYWSAGGTFWVGGHESAGVPAPARRWLHAEGATGAFFDMYILLANPNTTATQARLTYLLPDGSTVVRLRDLPAQSRTTVVVEQEDARLADTAVSVTVDADQPVISERAMYWPAPWQEAHNSFGQTETALRWGVADGCQGGPRAHDTYILLANPGSTAAQVRVTFLREHGDPVVRDFAVAATSRFNVAVGAEAPDLAGECFGAVVESTNGVEIAVERAVYWDARGTWWASGTNAVATKLR